ncbi:hypothetical protein IPN35_05995 [Candidatus Peregrinibacteria bacterium]|nr:MAG: hypothetical protein IPN35_05995 [Candidatus Peregrinibacteria bacterium]
MNTEKQHEKYNPLKDSSFWVAFFLSGVPFLPFLAPQGMLFDLAILICTLFLVTWTGWIIFKKGEKWSLIIGFCIAFIVAVASSYTIIKIKEHRNQVKMEEEMQELQEDIKEQIELGNL